MTDAADMPGPGAEGQRERVKQIHDRYLTALYQRDYYKCQQQRIVFWAKNWDFVIGLGAALSGGTGLGILADEKFAWLCGVITTLSVILTVAKTSYDWPGQIRTATDRIQDYSALSERYKILVENMNVSRAWGREFEAEFTRLREESSKIPDDTLTELPLKKRSEIQAGIRTRMVASNWWRPA